MLAIGLSLLQLNLLNEHDFGIELTLSLFQLLRHELDLLTHCLAADILRPLLRV